MKQQFVGGVIGITLVNLILFYTLSQMTSLGPVTAIGICLAVTVAIAILLFRQIMKPVINMQHKLEETVEENKKVERMRSEFVANVTHELKTPLTSISGFVETLQDGAAENPEIRSKFIDIIAIEASRLKRLIEDLLVLSDIENKREPQAVERINVKQSLERTVEAMTPIAKAHGIRLVTALDKNHTIAGSQDRFSQMMVNLIENAIKYSGESGKVYIRSADLVDKIQISIKDEGIGIAPEHFERLFERFYRVDKSRSQKEGGTGLGLSIVKHIAVLFDAELKVESELGEGTEFFIIFKKE